MYHLGRLGRILAKQDRCFKGDWNPTDGGTPANKVADKIVEKVTDATNTFIEGTGIFIENTYGALPKATKWVDDTILNGNVDLYTGGLISDAQNAAAGVKEFGRGEAVDDNLRAGARVAAVTAAAIGSGGTAAAVVAGATPNASDSTWENLIGGLAKSGGAISGIPGLKEAGGLINNYFNPPAQTVNGFTNDTNPYPVNIIEPGLSSGKVVPLIVIGVVLLTVAAVAAKKKRK